MNKIISKIFILVLIFAILPVVNANVECDTSIQPSKGTASVNGNLDEGEWDFDNDFFANMYEAGKEEKTLLSKLYLKYDCNEGKLYVLVLAENGRINANPVYDDDNYVKLGQNDIFVWPNGDGEFEFINNDSEGLADGWEASFSLTTPDDNCSYVYSDANVEEDGLNVHTQILYTNCEGGDDCESETRTSRPSHDSNQIDLCISCCQEIPEFPTMALPIAAILGLMFILQSRRRKED